MSISSTSLASLVRVNTQRNERALSINVPANRSPRIALGAEERADAARPSFLKRLFCCCCYTAPNHDAAIRNRALLSEKYKGIVDSTGKSYNDFIIDRTEEITQISLSKVWNPATLEKFTTKADEIAKKVISIDDLLKWTAFYYLSKGDRAKEEIETPSSALKRDQEAPYSFSKDIQVKDNKFNVEKAKRRLERIPVEFETDEYGEKTRFNPVTDAELLRNIIATAHSKLQDGFHLDYSSDTVVARFVKEMKARRILIRKPDVDILSENKILKPILSGFDKDKMHVEDLDAVQLQAFLTEWDQDENGPLLAQIEN